MSTPADQGIRAAGAENLLRKKLAIIRDEAMEIAATFEFSRCEDPTEHPVWQWATKVIKDTEQIMANVNGELSL